MYAVQKRSCDPGSPGGREISIVYRLKFRNCELPLSGLSLPNFPTRVRAVRPSAYFLFVYSAQLTGLKGERDFLDDNTEANYVESLVKEIAALSHGWVPTELLAAGDASELLPDTARPCRSILSVWTRTRRARTRRDLVGIVLW